MRKYCLIFLFCILQTSYSNPLSYRVSPAGLDSIEADGIERPWVSVGYALSRLPEAGSATIRVASGVYPAVRTTRRFENPVVILSEEPHKAKIVSASDSGPMVMNGVDNIVLDGFTIDNRNNESPSNALHIVGGCSRIVVRNCLITHGLKGYANADAVKVHQYSQNVLLENNAIFNACDELVEISGMVHDVVLRKNVFCSDAPASDRPMVGIYDFAWNVTVDGNLFVLRGGRDCVLQIGRGVTAAQDARAVKYLNNIIVAEDSSQRVAEGFKDIQIENPKMVGLGDPWRGDPSMEWLKLAKIYVDSPQRGIR